MIAQLAEIHWHKLLQDSLGALKNIMRDVDPPLYEKCAAQKDQKFLYLVMDPAQIKKSRHDVEKKWQVLEHKARQVNKELDVDIPYADHHIVGEHNGLNNGNILIID